MTLQCKPWIRNQNGRFFSVMFPEALHQALVARAARERLSLSDYVLDILKRREFLERLKSRSRVTLGLSAASLIREDRDKR